MKIQRTRKFLAMLLAVTLCAAALTALAEDGRPPEPPDGRIGGEPPAGMPPDGTPPDDPGGPGGAPGSSAPETYAAVMTCSEDGEVSGVLVSEAADENALLVTGGSTLVTGASVVRQSTDSTGGDGASFYGVGAAVLTTGGTVTIEGGTISTDARGGAGVFAYGEGSAVVRDTVITTQQDASGGIHVAGGGTLTAENLTVETNGASSAAIRSDRGGGTMTVTGGSYTANGAGSPAVYVTADIAIEDAILTATGSEALCLEGRNAVTLTGCVLSGNMPDQAINNGNTWTVILYQSMSGDAEIGKASFTMTGGQLISENGGLFYTTNTESEITLTGVEITAAEDCAYFLRCTGNSNGRGWGSAGANGADCVFTAVRQAMNGDVIWDSISTLEMRLTEGTVFTGAVIRDESDVTETGSGWCSLELDASSTWIVTADSELTSLAGTGRIIDAAGRAVRVAGTDGTVYAEGTSEFTVTVESWQS